MSIETDISEINSQSIASEEIVRQRMKELPYNSIVWSIANLFQKRESENSFSIKDIGVYLVMYPFSRYHCCPPTIRKSGKSLCLRYIQP